MIETKLLLIGFGPHAQRIYYPISLRDGSQYNFEISCIVDLKEKRSEIEAYFSKNSVKPRLLFVSSETLQNGQLTNALVKILNEAVRENNIRGVIIATDPTAHKAYALWALRQNLNILMDKPITAIPNSSTSPSAAKEILKDYLQINSLYLRKKRQHRLIFSLMAQRRYHAAYQKVRALVMEVTAETNCPITSIQSFHSDGQWRLPTEIVDIDYHSFNRGFGKFSHTGYHSIDIMQWLLKFTETPEKKINNVDIYTQVTRPIDFFSQISLNDYNNIFPKFKKTNKYSLRQLQKVTSNFGEIDAFSTLSFKHNEKVITLGSLNLLHNGFSQRGWLTPGKDLYKGNGRLRHETHYLAQGPFQAISFISYQSKEVNPFNKQNLFEVGAEYHLDIHVFRNKALFPHWKSYEKFSVESLMTNNLQGYSRGHQEDARRECILEFVSFVQGKSNECISELPSHIRCVALMSGLYLSSARKYCNQGAAINIKF